ncbi:YafY family transcriptional regulator [Roseomonas nepalensis]|uniref:YafY family transcriptional regulator n=1 Tax=Muricoccus nepalensis TaxID=1854500 RepID=A0A502G996_9PROT|nr:YafY family transcriptional regulator [Roseomonas nepalensis]
MSRSARLLDLLQALRRRRRPVTAAVLAGELGVSPRTLYRDVATLVAQGAPIEGEAGIGYVLRRGFFLPPLAFTADEVDALILGLRLVARRGDAELEAAARDALAKIEAVLPPEAAEAAEASGLLAGPVTTPGTPTPHLATIRRALAAEARLRLCYRDKAGAATERVVWPVAVGFFEATEVLVAWCETRGDFRHFRLDRIASAEPAGGRAPRRRRVLLADWRASQRIEGS